MTDKITVTWKQLAASLHSAMEYQYDQCDHGKYSGGAMDGEPYKMCEILAERMVRTHVPELVESPPFLDDKHMWHAGTLAGVLLGHGLSALPVYDTDGTITPIIQIKDSDGNVWSVVVMPAGSTAEMVPGLATVDDST